MEHPPLHQLAAEKALLRRSMRDTWRGLDLAAVSTAVTTRVLELPELAAAGCVAAYVGLPGEIDTTPLLTLLRARGVVVLLPVLLPDDSLDWRAVSDGAELVPGRRGTLEPAAAAPAADLADADAVVVPGLAYDETGARLGRGGGSFDRALVEVAERATVVALAPDQAVVTRVPTAPHDRPVDVVVTPTRVLRPRR